MQNHAVKVASEILWRLTGAVFGTCPITVRPCGRKCATFATYPAQLGTGVWINVACDCDGVCGCCSVCELKLEGPVASVTSVKMDGTALNPSVYRVDNGNMLVRVDGGPCWPTCQDLAKADTQVGTFSVTYQRGLPVPVGGQRAVAEMAAEIVKSCTGGACRLPSRVQEITRQGERIQLINDVEFLKSGLTGLPAVDMWVVAVNPYSHREPPSVYSPDLPPASRVTTWP